MNISEVIYSTLIDGNSWRTLLKGLGVTLYISLLSVILGTLMGMLVTAMRGSRFRPLSRLAALYIAVLRGSPVLLLTDEYYTDMISYVTKSFDMNRILEAMKSK